MTDLMSTNEKYSYLCDVISLLDMTLTEKGCHFFDSKSVNLFSTRQILCRYVGNCLTLLWKIWYVLETVSHRV